jgi:hypothetical protein
MFEPLSGFTNTNCTGRTNTHTHKLFLHEKPQFVSVIKGTTKKADAFGLFVYPNLKKKGVDCGSVCRLLEG